MNNNGLYRLWVPFRPQAQCRPRFNIKTRHAYQPEPLFKDCVVSVAVQQRPPRPLGGALGVGLKFCFRRPASRRYEIYKTTKPDLDNVEKPVLDALKRAGWIVDDACVVKTQCIKVWAETDGLEIVVKPLKNIRNFGE